MVAARLLGGPNGGSLGAPWFCQDPVLFRCCGVSLAGKDRTPSCEMKAAERVRMYPYPTGILFESVFSCGQCNIYFIFFSLQGSFSVFPLQNIS